MRDGDSDDLAEGYFWPRRRVYPRGGNMLHINTGQCGLCVHFGEEHPQEPTLLQIRNSMAAAEDFVDECHHPTHQGLHLKVTAVSGCDGFKPAMVQ